MARLDVMKNHAHIERDISHGPAKNNTTSVNASSKFQQKTGRTRVPPTGDTAAKMHSTPAVGLSAKANANPVMGKQSPMPHKAVSPLTNSKAAGIVGTYTGKAPRALVGSSK